MSWEFSAEEQMRIFALFVACFFLLLVWQRFWNFFKREKLKSEIRGWIVRSVRDPTSAERRFWATTFSREHYAEAEANFYKPFFHELERLARAHGVQVTDRHLNRGSARVVGRLRNCRALKADLRKTRLATMEENTVDIVPNRMLSVPLDSESVAVD